MSIAQKILANPSAYSIEMLTQGVKDGVIPAYIGIPLIQQKTQEKSQAAGMQGAQQGKQPPIAEEVLAQAQQASGVDQLPSNLPTQSYAPGGIVAFAEGGDVEYKYVRDPSGQMVKVPVEKTEKKPGVMDLMRQISDYSNRNANNPAAMAPTPAPTAVRPPMQPGQSYPGGISSLPTSSTPGIDQLVKPPAAPPPATGMGAPTGTGAGTGAASPFAFAQPPGGSLFDMTKGEIGGYASRSAARDRDLLNNLNEGKPVGKPLEDYKKSLQDEALQAGADRDQAKGMAIFKAGLAMMSGTSQYALENIGKGAMVGANDWQAANKDLIKAQKERQKELAAIEQAERAEARDDFKSAQKYRAEAADRADARDRFGVSAYMNAGVKDKEIATTQWGHVLDAQMKQYSTDVGAATSRDVANIGAGATRYAAELNSSAKIQAAELRAALAGAAGEKGQLTQDQRLKWRGEYASHPDVVEWKKQTLDQFGKNYESKPEFRQALAQKVDQVLARDMQGIGGGAAPAGYKFLGKE